MATLLGLKETKLLQETEDIIHTVGDWVSTAKFKVSKERSWEVCVDEDRETRIKTLLDQPHVKDKVRIWITYMSFLAFVEARTRLQTYGPAVT